MGVQQCELKDILPLRNLFLQETNKQIRYNAYHERGWTNSYLVTQENETIGYGSVKGNENITDRDTIFEFYLVPSYRHLSSVFFIELLQNSKAKFIECQSNDHQLTPLLYAFAENINSAVVLFEESISTALSLTGIFFRKRKETDIIFEHSSEPVGDFVLEFNGEIIATGGFLLHYNFPFCDLFMEVKHNYRRKGFGSYLLQEVKKQALPGRQNSCRKM